MEKVREITEDEHNRLDRKFHALSDRLVELYERLGWINATLSLFYSEANQPCVFGSAYTNPRTGQAELGQPLPSGFRAVFKESKRAKYDEIYHFSPAGCPELIPHLHVVKCLAAKVYTNEYKIKYYYGEHRVGECPHKKKQT